MTLTDWPHLDTAVIHAAHAERGHEDLYPGRKIGIVKPVEGVPMRVRLSPYYRRHGRIGLQPMQG